MRSIVCESFTFCTHTDVRNFEHADILDMPATLWGGTATGESQFYERCRRLHVSHDIWEVSYDTSDTPPHTLKRINFLVYHMSPRVRTTP